MNQAAARPLAGAPTPPALARSIDEFLEEADARSAAATKSAAMLLQNPEVQALITKTKQESAEEASTFFLGVMMLAIQNLHQGDKLRAGQALDDAISNFMIDLATEMGETYTASAAAGLIHNIALFLPTDRRERVLAALSR
jgi:hypothetical protein